MHYNLNKIVNSNKTFNWGVWEMVIGGRRPRVRESLWWRKAERGIGHRAKEVRVPSSDCLGPRVGECRGWGGLNTKSCSDFHLKVNQKAYKFRQHLMGHPPCPSYNLVKVGRVWSVNDITCNVVYRTIVIGRLSSCISSVWKQPVDQKPRNTQCSFLIGLCLYFIDTQIL